MTDNPIIEQLRLETQQLMDQLRERAESERSTFRRLLVNGYDMLMATPETTECLVDPIIPRTGVVALVGTSDSGKSTFLRSLAMAVASGAHSFLGFALHPRQITRFVFGRAHRFLRWAICVDKYWRHACR